MNTYANLEVSQDGVIYQSSIAVPADGVLPKPMASSSTRKPQKAYSEKIAPITIEAAVAGPDSCLRITAIYAPTHVRGAKKLLLLLPITVAFIATYGALALLYASPALTDIQQIVLSMLMTVTVYFLAIYPCVMWARHLYFQGGPGPLILRKMAAKYPRISVYSDREEFLLATQADL